MKSSSKEAIVPRRSARRVAVVMGLAIPLDRGRAYAILHGLKRHAIFNCAIIVIMADAGMGHAVAFLGGKAQAAVCSNALTAAVVTATV